MTHPTAPRLFVLFVAALMCLATQGTRAEHNLSDFEPGSFVTGTNLDGKDIRGKVVVLEYWGITCGPCIRAIPHTTELAKKYGHDKLVIIANQVWSASDNRTAETWNKHAKNDMVMVVNGGKLDGFSPRGVPRALIFDHTGKSVWEGHPGSMDKALADAIANLPEPTEEGPADDEQAAEEAAGPKLIIEGLEPEYFRVEMNRINTQNRNVTSTLDKLRRAAERATDQAQVDEAKMIVAAVEAWAKGQQARIEATQASDPATAYTTAEELVALLKGDDLAKQAGEFINEIREDGELFHSVRATIMLRGVLAEAKSIGLDKDNSVVEDKANARSIRLIDRDLDRLIQDYPKTEAGQRAKTLQAEWGLED